MGASLYPTPIPVEPSSFTHCFDCLGFSCFILQFFEYFFWPFSFPSNHLYEIDTCLTSTSFHSRHRRHISPGKLSITSPISPSSRSALPLWWCVKLRLFSLPYAGPSSLHLTFCIY